MTRKNDLLSSILEVKGCLFAVLSADLMALIVASKAFKKRKLLTLCYPLHKILCFCESDAVALKNTTCSSVRSQVEPCGKRKDIRTAANRCIYYSSKGQLTSTNRIAAFRPGSAPCEARQRFAQSEMFLQDCSHSTFCTSAQRDFY